MARCPTCDDALTSTLHERVSLGLCNACGGTWATHEDLEELHGGPVDVAMLPGKTTHRCASCRQTLAKARLDSRVEVELCPTCRGVFFAPGKLSAFRPLRSKQLQAVAMVRGFVCGKCGQQFPLAEGTAYGAGLACRKCAGLDGPDPHRATEEAEQSLVDWVARHRLVFLAILGVVLTVAIVGAQLAWEGFLGGMLDEAATK